jgi:superfamily I DNA and RNA helicase
LKGFAGSGKSVLLLHCLLIDKRRNPETKAIIVLYTHSLIDMIKEGIPQ